MRENPSLDPNLISGVPNQSKLGVQIKAQFS